MTSPLDYLETEIVLSDTEETEELPALRRNSVTVQTATSSRQSTSSIESGSEKDATEDVNTRPTAAAPTFLEVDYTSSQRPDDGCLSLEKMSSMKVFRVKRKQGVQNISIVRIYKNQLEDVITILSQKLDIPRGQRTKMVVPLDKLLLDRGLIATVPARLYKIVEGRVVFDDLAQELITSFEDSGPTTGIHSEKEWALLFEVEPETEDTSNVDEICEEMVIGEASTVDIDDDEIPTSDHSDVDMEVACPSGISGSKSRSLFKRKQQQGRKCPAKKRKVMIESDSEEEDEENKGKEGMPLEERLVKVWKALLPPTCDKELESSWVAYIHTKTKKIHQLIFARLKCRFLHDSDGVHLDRSQWEVNCCKPYRVESQTSNIEEVPGGEQDFVNVYDIICYFPKTEGRITYDKLNLWNVSDMDDVVKLFNECLKVDRNMIFTEGMN